MKRNLLIKGMLLAATFPCFANYTVGGHINNTDGGKILFIAVGYNGNDTLGSATTNNGNFNFSGKVDSPVAAEIIVEKSKLRVPIFLEENQTYKVEADAKNLTWNVDGGGSLQQCRREFKVLEDSVGRCKAAVMEEFQKNRGDYDDSYIWRTDRRWAIEKIDKQFDPIESDFIAAHDNMVSASLIARRLENLMMDKTLPAKYELLGPVARQSAIGKRLVPKVELVSKIIVGGQAPDFTMATPQGDSLSLSSVKGKIKIIDFWASWCGPCRQENPTLKKLYAQYRDKGLEIISVSLDTDKKSWIEAIEHDGLPWVHMSELGRRNTARDQYLVWAIPQIYILDGNDTVLAEGLRGKLLEDFIASKLD